MTRTILANC